MTIFGVGKKNIQSVFVLYVIFILYFMLSTQLDYSAGVISLFKIILNLFCFVLLIFILKRNIVDITFFSVCSFLVFIPAVFVSSLSVGDKTLGILILTYSSCAASFISAYYFFHKKHLLKPISLWLFLSYLIYLFFCLVDSYFKGVLFHIYANDLFVGQSRNAVSFYLIFCAVFYLISCRLTESKPSFILIFIAFIFSILLFGRSGILVCTSLVLLTVIFYYNSWKSILAGFVILLILLFNLNDIINLIVASTNLSQGVDSPRSAMLNEFFIALDFKGLFLGVELSKLPTVNSFAGNPHNSFIFLNLKFGWAILVFISLSIFIIFMLAFKDFFLFCLFLLLLLRYSLDSIAFDGNFTDVLYYLFLCFCLYGKKSNAYKGAPLGSIMRHKRKYNNQFNDLTLIR